MDEPPFNALPMLGSRPIAPCGARITRGTRACPPDINRIFAAWLTIRSIAQNRKSAYWNSTTGRRPVSAAPTAMPMNPASEMGVSHTRSGPNSSSRPAVTWYAPPKMPISSPSRIMAGSRRISCARASRIESAIVSLRIRFITRYIVPEVVWLNGFAGPGEGDGNFQFCLDL